MTQPNRWSQFEDDEITELHAAACVSVGKIRSRNLDRLAYELQDEIARRRCLDAELGLSDTLLDKIEGGAA